MRPLKRVTLGFCVHAQRSCRFRQVCYEVEGFLDSNDLLGL
jgi:hypothetical protein